MELNIEINTDKKCKVTIMDRTKYLNEQVTNISDKTFKFSETASIIIIEHKKSKENILKTIYDAHTEKAIDIPIDFDGWFKIHYLVLPTREWFEREKNITEGSALTSYNLVYFIDDQIIYKYIDGKEKIVPLKEIFAVNPNSKNTLLKIEKDYVSICFLEQCYINLCQQIFEQRGFSQCWNKSTIDSELVYKRDLVWMALNVVKYLTSRHSEENPTLAEVERIIEILQGCNGICKSTQSNQPRPSGCGCSK